MIEQEIFLAAVDKEDSSEQAVYLDQACGPWTDWFSADDGLRVVLGLLTAVREGSTRDLLSDAETVVHDLEELARCLAVAARRGARFRLAAG